MIQLHEVSKFYKDTAAVNDVSFDVREGENMVLLGTSGCGKTTTLRMINRLTEPSKGKILVNGTNVLQQSPEKLRKGIGYVLQHTGLFPHYTVKENISIVPGLLKWNARNTRRRVLYLLKKLHLPAERFANLYPGQLSGGQQQRVGLARALAADPPVLLMDEPFGALDPVTRAGIRKDFSELEEFKKKTIVLVTHDVQEAFELGDRICLMDKGKIVQMGTPAELLFKPADEFVRSFFHEQRFTLELQSISIKDIWPFLPNMNNTEGKSIPADTSLWNAIQMLSHTNPSGTNTNSLVENEGQHKEISITLLLAGYGSYRNSIST